MQNKKNMMPDEDSFSSVKDSDFEAFDEIDDDADEEFTDEELDEILGRSGSRKKLILGIAGIGLALVVIVWLFTGVKPGDISSLSDKDSLDTAEPDSAEVLATAEVTDSSTVETAEKPSQKVDETSPAPAEVEDILSASIKGETDILSGAAASEFYSILNAEVSSEEMAALTDDDFQAILFEPLMPSPKMPITARTEETLRQWIEARSREIEQMPLDSTRFLTAIDSLNRLLSNKDNQLLRAISDKDKALERLDRLKNVSDSMRSFEVKKLAKIIEAMKPNEAAMLLEDKSSAELIEVLFRVKPRTAAQILEELPPRIGADVATRIIKQ